MIIQELRALWAGTLEMEDVSDSRDPIATVLATENGVAKYVEAGGKLIGLHLANTGIDDTRCKEIFDVLGDDMQYVQVLNISGNVALKEVRLPENCAALRYLDVSNCALSVLHIPEGMGQLEKLWLQENRLQEFTFARSLPHLDTLDLSKNQLRTFHLTAGYEKLASLYLDENSLEEITFARPLLLLRMLYLRKNKVKTLPENLARFRSLHGLMLYENPDLDIPQEHIAESEWESSWASVKSRLLSVEQSGGVRIPLREAKMILVGNGEVGKTSISRKLRDPNARLPEKSERTQGFEIAIEPYMLKDIKGHITGLEEAIDFRLNIWDFGGQGRYCEVQQLFCSRKTLYLFVTAHDDTDANEDYVGFEYWLSMVNAFAYDEEEARYCPVIHVVNKIDEKKKRSQQETIEETFPNIYDFVEISCKDVETLGALEKAIRGALKEISSNNSIFTDDYADYWMRAKENLKQRINENHISVDDYKAECANVGMSEEEAMAWIQVLNRIGSVLYFDKNEALADWVILNPKWVKAAMVRVLDNDLVKVNKGVLRPGLFKHVWSEYTEEEHEKLVAMMLAYALCYRQKDIHGNTEYVIPALLSDTAPVFPSHLVQADQQLKVCYTPYIPAGTVNKLIVNLKSGHGAADFPERQERMMQKPLLHGGNVAVYNNMMWKNNVIVQDASYNAYAHVRESWDEKTVYIDLYGSDTKPLFDYILEFLEALNQNLKDTKRMAQLSVEPWGFSKKKNKWYKLEDLLDGIDPDFLGSDQKETYSSQIKQKTMQPKQQIQKLIEQARLTEALKALKQAVPSHLSGEVSMLISNLNDLDKKRRQGIISQADIDLRQNRITESAIELCGRLDENSFQGNDQEFSEPEKETLAGQGSRGSKRPGLNTKPAIYFSYAWGDKNETGESREQIVDELYESLMNDGYNVQRDKKDVRYGDLISNFMGAIGKGKLVAVFVSDKYLRSEYCMFELYEVARNNKWEKDLFAKSVMLIPVESIKINDPEILDVYYDHWESRKQKWQELSEKRVKKGKKPHPAYNKMVDIDHKVMDLYDWLADINAKTETLLRKNNFEEVKQLIMKRAG